jgi:hypothetical protein
MFDANDFANDRATFLSDGVFVNPSDNFKVYASNGNMTVTVGASNNLNTAFIQGRSFIAEGRKVLEVPAASTQFARIDIVVIRMSNLSANRNIQVLYREGNPSSSPVAPSLIRNADEWEIQLAQVSVASNVSTITQTNVLDTRLNTNLCGIVVYLGQQVDTTAIFSQYQTYLNEQISAWNTIKNTQQTNWSNQTATQQTDFTTQLNNQQTSWANWFSGVQTDLSRAVFDFDNLYILAGVNKVVTDNGNSISEVIRTGTTAGSGTVIASRDTTFPTDAVQEVVAIYATDGSLMLQTTNVTTFPSSSTIVNIVS